MSLTGDKSLFWQYTPFPSGMGQKMLSADGSTQQTMWITLNGRVALMNRDSNVQFIMHELQYVPSSTLNLLSVNHLMSKGYEAVFTPSGMDLQQRGKSILKAQSHAAGIWVFPGTLKQLFQELKQPVDIVRFMLTTRALYSS